MQFCLVLFLPTISKASREKKALEKAALAAYKQSGIENNVNVLLDKWTPELIKQYGSAAGIIKAAIVDKQINLKWEF